MILNERKQKVYLLVLESRYEANRQSNWSSNELDPTFNCNMLLIDGTPTSFIGDALGHGIGAVTAHYLKTLLQT